MTQKTIVITGASDGIGAAAARILADQGHRLILLGRSREKTEAVARQTGAEVLVADFARLDDVRAVAAQIASSVGPGGIDVLANNAGGIFGDPTPTVDGFEKTLQVNHLAPFLLTGLLLPQLRRGGASIVNTSSVGHRYFGKIDLDDLDNRRAFSANKAYGDAKLANVLFTVSLHTKLHGEGISAVAFHPRGRPHQLRRGDHQRHAVHLSDAAAEPDPDQPGEGRRDPRLVHRGRTRHDLAVGPLLRPAQAHRQGEPAGP